MEIKVCRLPVMLALLVLTKAALDYFAFHVSGVYGIYGIDVRGDWFTSRYFLSWLVSLAVFISALPYLSICRDEIDFAVVFLVVATFLPSASVFWAAEGDGEFFAFGAVFWVACLLLLYLVSWVAPWAEGLDPKLPVSRMQAPLSALYAVVLALLLVNLLRSYSIGLDFGFDTVYQRRKEFVAWLSGGWTYLYAWAVYVFAAYLVFVSRSKPLKLFGLGYTLVFFLAAGDKVYLFLIALMAVFRVLRHYGRAVPLLLSGFAVLFALAAMLDSLWLGFIVNRFVILPLDIAYRYASHFAGEHLMYGYSFLSGFFPYRYDGAPSQIIGDIYYKRGDGANVNFLADAYVNLGWLALPALLTFFIGLRVVFRNSRYLVLLCPLLVQLMNAPLPTVLLTGGGILMIVGCLLLLRSNQQPVAVPHPLSAQ
ncbi:hypothetical protein [Cupriavidus taiwanensis]|uniref:hypothetical protein n=1 Tax=Cupriavidus taiwanensis TaxID=164546 RepID=UPI0011C05FC9|nr:hypothetical protein [Cupriavidus taiwanensis]